MSNLLNTINPELLTSVLALAIVLGLIIMTKVIHSIHKHEIVKKHQRIFDILFKLAMSSVTMIAFKDIDLTKYEAIAQKRMEKGLTPIDPRMLYVIDVIQKRANTYGLRLSIEEAWSIGESEYQKWAANNADN